WKGIYFRDQTNNGLTLLEHCHVEYGGHTHNADIYLANAKPTIQYNTILNSSHSGIIADNTGSNGAVINCNNFKDNIYGINTINNALPTISHNNFLRNQNYGLYNNGSSVNAVNNWWGDTNGPNTNGDDTYGNVVYTPWLVAESDCISTPPTNSPPFAPGNPSPSNGAVRVPVIDEGIPSDVTLGWAGGDPNPWDTVVYDVYLGTDPDSLPLVAGSLPDPDYAAAGLDEGTIYYWKIVSRDNGVGGLETTGPVWHFTTLGAPPDLIISNINWNPASDLQAGQSITFTATVENTGSGPVVDAFQVEFYIGGQSIGSRTVNSVMLAGTSLPVDLGWTAATGDHTIEVTADSQQKVAELFEENNTQSGVLPHIQDPTPPDLVNTVPADGGSVKQANTVTFTLADQYGAVDTAAVVTSVAVTDGSGLPVSGTVAEGSNVFTFTPDTIPLADGTYTVAFTAQDLEGNTQQYSFLFTVDGQPPTEPTITGGVVLSGLIQQRPSENNSNTTTVTLTGTREANTSVWINSLQQVAQGSGDWSVDLTLAQGDNALEIWLEDAAANRSPSVWVDIRLDSAAPAISAVSPADNSFINTPPPTVMITFQETLSGLSLENSSRSIKDGNQAEVDGTWSVSGADQLVFISASPLAESFYTLAVQLEDNFTNRGPATQFHFTVDLTPPAALVVDQVVSPTHNPTQTVSGTKEAYAAIWLNGQQVVDYTADTTWQHAVNLNSGTNTLTFFAKDRAGNQGPETAVEIVFDDIAPPPVDSLTIDNQGDGLTVVLNWSGYDEAAHGDVAEYRIYYETAGFSVVSGLTPKATVSAGNFTYTAQSLTRGAIYWFAVIAVDVMGNAHATATPISGVPADVAPPEDVTNLTAQSFADRLIFSWDHSANSYQDLAGYHVYFDNATEAVVLPATQNTYERTGLSPAEDYLFKVVAYDQDANESTGKEITGVTWLPNPANLAAEPYAGYVDLAWNAASPAAFVKHYAVYVSESDITTVDGLTPTLTTAAASAKIAGLTNDVTYYFAVTTVNTSDGQDPVVSAISATPEADAAGPEITDVQVDGTALLGGHTLTKPAAFTCMAADPAGVSRVEYLIDGNLIRIDYSPEYSAYWNIVPETDGDHTLTITAYDTLANSTTLDFALNVALVPPAAPIITLPQNGRLTNRPIITVSGLAEKDSELMLYNNSAEAGSWLAVDATGDFSSSLTLVEGENRLQAAARNRAGTGPMSAEIVATLDTTLPQSPIGLSAAAKAAGEIRLAWQAPPETLVSGYNLYRSDSAISDPASADKVNVNLITATVFNDLPPSDGTWYYRVATVDTAANESDLSNEAAAVSDNTMPRAGTIDYTPQGQYDPVSGTMAPGTVNVVLTVSEALQTDPYLSIVPEGGVPISVDLSKDSDVTYVGFFVIGEATPGGTAYAIFSARDIVGNRGTEIDAGAAITIDTDGPAISRLVIGPASPIQNQEQDPVTVTATIGLNEMIKGGDRPQLSYRLSQAGRQAIDIDQIDEISTRSGDAQTWQAVFSLPADAGLTEPETLRFIYQGTDDLNNASDKITAANLFQVYQGELPPLAPPDGLMGDSLPGGMIKLTWNAVPNAAGYQLYRQAPDESELTEYERLDMVAEYTDAPALEGAYTYAIASIRTENQQEAFSAVSSPVVVVSDSAAPGVPLNLSLELVANGIKAQWQPPPYTEEISYSLYRAPAEITTLEGLTPLATGIGQTLVVDPTPSPTDHYYVVTAVDSTGNESAPSNCPYLNFDLLPVSAITVRQTDNDPPLISWAHPGGSIAGYDIYLESGQQPVKLNSALLTETTFTDIGYAGDERRYTVIAVDVNNVQSLGRSITLPVASAALAPLSQIKRGIMNRMEYGVENLGSSGVGNMRLRVNVGAYAHVSEIFSLASGASADIPVIVGGYDDLLDIADLTTTIEITPNAGELVEIIRISEIEVGDGTLVLQLLNEEFTRGASGSVQFALQNSGEAEIEIVTARNSGSSASNQITFYLLDEDENVLTSFAFKQNLGNKIVTLSNGNTVARIPAGETFASDAASIPVPANAPDDITIRLDISDIYYHQGQTDQVKMNGLSANHPVALVDTAYYGEITSIAPQTSTGDEDIFIGGRAVERATGQPMPGVPLNLVVATNGFERSYEVFTAGDGAFTYTFTPLAGEAGIYTVRAVHPDLTDKPLQGQFVINRVTVTPASINLSIPKNYEKTVNIKIATGDGTEINNLQLVYDAADQPEGEYPAGVHLTTEDPVENLGGSRTTYLPFTVWADNTVAETGSLVLKVKSDETDPAVWGTIVVNTHFSEAQPVLYFAPNHVETGVAIDDTVIETVVLENRGLADLHDIRISLVDQSGSPAPAWAYLNTAEDLGTMAVGDARSVNIAFSPKDGAAEDVYGFYLRVDAANYPTTDINLYASVTQSGIGNVLFKVSDIYTDSRDQNGEEIHGLAGARVKLQNELVHTEEYTQNTDSLGEAYFSHLPSGRYKVRITAVDHQEYIGRIWVKPGITITEAAFLDYNLVTVEWEVTEITIEDKYEIVLNATYETDVPAAVVIIEPASVVLPKMKAGDVFNGEFTLTNYGLIRAQDVKFSLPSDDQYFTFEFLRGMPQSIEAKERVTVPYRVTCLKSLEQEEEGDGSGGGTCNSYRKCANVDYAYECINGTWSSSAISHCWTYSYGDCSGSGGGGGTYAGGGTWNVAGAGGGGGGSVSKPAPKPKTIEGVECFPQPPRQEKFCFQCWLKDTFGSMFQDTFSSVNLVMREYYREHVDLSVKAPGGTIEVKRWFYGNQWLWEHDRNKLESQPASIGDGMDSIDKGGVIYEKSSTDADIFIHDIFKILKTDTGFRWQDPKGGWIDYDESGNVTSYGSRTGIQAKLLYQDSKLSGVADRNDNQVLWYETNDDGLIAAVYDADNRRVDYSYTDGRLSKVNDVLGYETRFEYDAQGRLEKIIEPAGRTITVSYDKYNGVASVLNSQGEGFFFEYQFNEATQEQYARIETSAGKIKEVWYDRDFETRRVDINGRTVQKIAKDGRDLLITDEQGHVTRKEYDEWDNLTRVIHPDGTFVATEYEHKFNKATKQTDENGQVTEYEHDGSGNLTRKIEAVGTGLERVTEYTYDVDGNLLTVKRPADANTAEALTVMTYDETGNLTSITDPEGGLTRFTSHDALGNVLTREDARGKQWTYEYDAAGRLESVTDPIVNATEPYRNVTRFYYDEVGNKTRQVDPQGKETLYDYDENNNLSLVTDPSGNFTRFEYNSDGKLIKQIDSEDKVIRYEYDPDGRLSKTTDGNGNEIAMEYADSSGSGCSSCSGGGGASNQPSRIIYPTFAKEFVYDKRGRKTIEKDILSDTETYLTDFDYDPAGNLAARTDKEHKTTGYDYDDLNRLSQVTDALSKPTQYTYDNRDNLMALTDAENNITWFEYDRNNRLVKEIRPEGQQTAYDYDDAGNLIEKTDAKNQKTEYDYDDAGRLVQISYFAASDHDNPVKTVTFSYDRAGNLTGYDDGTTSAAYTYDDLYRKLSETVNYGTFEQTSSYTYYKNGLKKTFTGPDGVGYAYTYDANNQLTGVNIPGAGYITYTAYTWNRPKEVILPGGSKREYGYDPLMRVKSIAAKDPGQNIMLNFQYDYDKMDNITAKVTEHGEYDYGYDDLYRLTGADNPVQADEGFTYDAVGNRMTAAGVADNWSYNDNNELQGYDAVTFEYDDNGNMTKKMDAGQVTNYIYNVEDRLERVEDGSGSLISTYYYDPFGRRLWKEINGIRTYFVYADEGLVA
ncbi:diguanylate cyclase/phosphodiesterase (GGDEF & EAL domains) with PAS/PAC sensor(s), partial [Olavius sp. associated proteobacterium Delta 1]